MIHGVLLVNKKEGGTSHDVVQSIRKLLKQRQVGHAGTLDPMAEGLMVILLGYGTKLSQWLLRGDKSYHFVFRLGVKTDTLDKTGQVTMTKKVQIIDNSPTPKENLPPKPSFSRDELKSVDKKPDCWPPLAKDKEQEAIKLKKELIEEVIKKAQGEISMPVPVFSAVKVEGQKLYEYQRRGQSVAPPVRQMVFYDVRVKDIQMETVEVTLSCQKGSYVRAWVSYIGEQLGTGACLESLTRLSSTPFGLNQALSLEELKQRLSNKASEGFLDVASLLKPAFLPFHQALPHIPAVKLLAGDEGALKHGKLSIDLKYALQERQKEVNKNRADQIIRAISRGGKMLALFKLTPFKSPRIEKVFPPSL